MYLSIEAHKVCNHKEGDPWKDGCCRDVLFLKKVLNTFQPTFAVLVLVMDYARKHGKPSINQEVRLFL